MRHCVRWGPSSSKRGHSIPHFSTHVSWTNGWTDQDTTGTEVGLGPGHVLDGDPLLKNGHSSPLNFWPMSVVVYELYLENTVTL